MKTVNLNSKVQAEVIDQYIDFGYSYEDAYQMMVDDYNRGLITVDDEIEEEIVEIDQKSINDETYKLTKKQATIRGYSENEAAALAELIMKAKNSGNFSKMGQLIARLES